MRLSQIVGLCPTFGNRAMVERAVEMAVLKLGDGNKFKNCRVGIELDNDTLTCSSDTTRSANVQSQEDGGW